MLNVLIVAKDVDYSLRLLNKFGLNSKFRIGGILDNVEDLCKIRTIKYIDIILLDSEFLSEPTQIFKNFIYLNQESIIILTSKDVKISSFKGLPSVNKRSLTEVQNAIIERCSHTLEMKLMKNKIMKELEWLGYKKNYVGTQYIAEIIYLVYCTKFDGSLEKNIYPHIANIHHKNFHTLKCNIVNATNMMAIACPVEKLTKYLGADNSKPGPKTIIYAVIHKISV